MRLLHKHKSATSAKLAGDRTWDSSIGTLSTQLVALRRKGLAKMKKVESKFVFSLTTIGEKVHALGLLVEGAAR